MRPVLILTLDGGELHHILARGCQRSIYRSLAGMRYHVINALGPGHARSAGYVTWLVVLLFPAPPQ